MATGKIFRVIQWATGNIGTRGLRTVIEHPQMQLVGLWVSSPANEAKPGIRTTVDLPQVIPQFL